MNAALRTVPEFLARSCADQAALDRAIARAELLAKVRRCQVAVSLLKRRQLDELNRAAIDIANATQELAEFDAGRAPR